MDKHIVLRTVSQLLIPAILLFALYVQFHGDFGPGGGFQAGVIFGAAFVLHGLLFGLDAIERVAPPAIMRLLAAAGLLLYAGVGVASMLAGERYLDYDPLGSTPIAGQHWGIVIIELGVGITVASVMILMFCSFARRH